MESYHKLIGKHKGETAFIVAAGPSLFDIYKNSNFSKIFDHIVISVNSSNIIMPWEQGSPERRYWVSNDALCRRWTYWKRLKELKAIKIVRNSWKKYYSEIPDFLIFNPRKTSEDIVDFEEKNLCYCSSVPTSLDLAIQMGCKKVFLLGVDQYMKDGKTHFWHFLPPEKQPRIDPRGMTPFHRQMSVFNVNRKAYSALSEFAKYKKVSVYNCNPISNITIFEKIKFEENFEK